MQAIRDVATRWLGAWLAACALCLLPPWPAGQTALGTALWFRARERGGDPPPARPIHLGGGRWWEAILCWALGQLLLPVPLAYVGIEQALQQTLVTGGPIWPALLVFPAVARLPRAHPWLVGGVFTLLFTALCFWPPSRFVGKALFEPVPGGYAYDGHIYLRALYLEARGLDHYHAQAAGYAGDARHIPLTVIRLPAIFAILGALPPGPIAYGALWAVTMPALLLMAQAWVGRVASREGAWLAVVLLGPYLVYGFLSSSWIFCEYWAWLAGLAALLAWERPLWCVALATLALFIREQSVYFVLPLALASCRRQPRLILAWLAAGGLWAWYYAWHRLACLALYRELNQPPDAQLRTLRTLVSTTPNWGGWGACFKYGLCLYGRSPFLAPATAILGTVGLWRARAYPLLATVAALALTYLFFNHNEFADTPDGRVYMPDYWGITLTPWLLMGTAALLCGRPPAEPEEPEAA